VVDKPITMDNLRLLCLVVNICRGTVRRPRYKYSITARWKFCIRFINSRLNTQYLLIAIVWFVKQSKFSFGILKYVCDIVVKSSRSLSHLLMSSCFKFSTVSEFRWPILNIHEERVKDDCDKSCADCSSPFCTPWNDVVSKFTLAEPARTRRPPQWRLVCYWVS